MKVKNNGMSEYAYLKLMDTEKEVIYGVTIADWKSRKNEICLAEHLSK